MSSKYHPREVQAKEAAAVLYWDTEKKDYVFPSEEKMDAFIRKWKEKPAEAQKLKISDS